MNSLHMTRSPTSFFLHLFGFGKRFVSFDSAASAEAAIQGLNNVAVGGRRLKVMKASYV